MKVKCGNTQVDSSLVVVDCGGPLLCGRNTIQAFQNAGMALLEECAPQNVNVLQCDAAIVKLLVEFSEIFEERLGCCKGPPVRLHRKEAAIQRFLKARPVPYALREKVSEEIDRQVQEGVLSPVRVSEWATPVVPLVKRSGDIRLCGDFKLTVNPAIHLEQYPLPKIEDIFASLYGGEVFTTLDLRHACNQLPLDDEARKMAVFNTHKGLFAYNRLAFGIASAPALFQRCIESLLQGLPRVKVYLDDIIVAEKAKRQFNAPASLRAAARQWNHVKPGEVQVQGEASLLLGPQDRRNWPAPSRQYGSHHRSTQTRDGEPVEIIFRADHILRQVFAQPCNHDGTTL